ncbi:MAG: carboxymuconolactone decarboxylase family protein [Eubacteriales bacterium]
MEKTTAGRDSLGKFAPKFAELNDDVLFGEVWSREDKLSPRDRSLITVTALMTSGIFDSSLSYHMQKAKENGVSRTEIAEILTQLAFYSGWPKAWAAFRLAKEVWTENCGTAEEFAKTSLFPVGEPNTAFGQYFTGNSYLKILSGKLGMTVANVTFEPRCRNNWHIHKAESGGGQILLCTEGEGWYQEWEKPARRLRSGDVVEIPAGIKHWHGAAKDKWFSHIALEVPGKGTSNEWLEPVSEKDYEKLK